MFVPPAGFYIGSRMIAFYGIIMTIAILIAYFLTRQLAMHRKIEKKSIALFALVTVPVGIVGARFLHVMLHLGEYSFVEAIAFWNGFSGLSIYGCIIFGLLAIFLLCYFKKVNFFSVCDVLAPGFILAQGIGRWGNFFNQELYGPVVSFKVFPFSTFIEATEEWHASMFFYEFLANTAGFFILAYILKKTKKPGVVTAAYMIFYGTVRFVMEPFRVDDINSGWGSVWQIISIIAILSGIAILLYLYVFKKCKDNKKGKEDVAVGEETK